MAAAVETRYWNGAGPSSATATNLRFNVSDDNDQDTGNPCVKPAAGTNYSAWKNLTLWCGATAPDNDIANVKIYTDGTLGWTGCTVQVGDEDIAIASYDQASGSGDSWDEMVANYVGISAKTDLFTYTSGSSRSVTEAAAWSTPGTNETITKFIVLQLDVGSTATGGSQSAETITWQYDET
jgi:hypothetical protein